MPRRCSVCSHENSVSINEALVLSKQGNRRIATQFGLSEAAVRRHREHIPELLVQAANHGEVYGVEQILDRVEELQRKTLDILERAEDKNDDRALRAIREARSNLELIAKVRHLISDAPQVNILIAPHVQDAIIGALRPYNEARLAVSNALAELEASHAGG